MKALAAGLATVALLAACGGGSGSGQPAGSIKVTMTDYKFDPSSITASHGKVIFWLINASTTTQHDMAILDSSKKALFTSELVSAGDTKEFDIANLDPGSYDFQCTQPGHADAGMKGTLTLT